ncbi:hypothetical protein OCU04_011936 [Sclerotinia nivalis]|uniref:MYND-type domain-containing protein n=1 Tax=Sclerotinia nivalis TaxID=352851 RepID=A0A9X0DES5_9HELO|nr:hypothetical protein OCU04_011936 [Sclerotinia nivalis]
MRITGPSTCSVCYDFASTKLLCGSCKSIAYCSPKCQKLDWSLHKTLCKEFASLSPRPSKCHKLAFYFPVDFKYPKLEWLQCPRTPQAQSSDEEADELLLRKDMDHKGNTIESSFIFCRGDCLDNDPKLNQSIISVAKGAHWNGPLVIFRKHRPGSSSTILDVVLADFPIIIKMIRQLPPIENNSKRYEVVKPMSQNKWGFH